MTIKLTTDHIRIAGIFERLTGVHVKDCLMDEECVYFLIEPGKMGMAIGKNGNTIKNVSRALGKSVKIFEYADTIEKMIKNFIPNLKSMDFEGNTVTISVNVNDRSTVIGKNGRNIKMIREFLKRHFKIENLRLK
ncbi:MAG: NusA-like transcription termination signal-binding factor [Candidatus Aenigmarchaeota archaeon]|nr:NusA-like transcription termination signal-binding factor [Candidatus Aenigmarchaeota archaeon]NIP41010.1 NusA-like transcription termination signal-binding factor [Candidatus Aenigmarchaeota archaeon]NIQ17412.1 NusA-like transcription termination signal-binding factor [Candidatus Aenigmarchaeota archaeon]NIS73606.1 NusA-like transcription termination signal-binding factor [Candidatus Aenigmarchaeota archaeon]